MAEQKGEEVPNQIGNLAKEFEELDGNDDIVGEEEAELSPRNMGGGGGGGIPSRGEEMEIPRREERPKSRMGEAISRGEVIDLRGEPPVEIC